MINNYIPPHFNLATSSKWFLVIPMELINPNRKNVALNLFQMTLPTLSHGSVDFGTLGTMISIPTGVRDSEKSITFSYILSEDWHQYRLLYEWFNTISSEDFIGRTSNTIPYIDLQVYILTAYKNKMFTLTLKNCWLKEVASIDFNYQNGDYPLQHSFTVNFSHYEFNDLIDTTE